MPRKETPIILKKCSVATLLNSRSIIKANLILSTRNEVVPVDL